MVKAMPDLEGDAAREKRKEDFYRAVALGIETAAQALTDPERLVAATADPERDDSGGTADG